MDIVKVSKGLWLSWLASTTDAFDINWDGNIFRQTTSDGFAINLGIKKQIAIFAALQIWRVSFRWFASPDIRFQNCLNIIPPIFFDGNTSLFRKKTNQEKGVSKEHK